MFTGIIQELGTVRTVARTRSLMRLDIHAPQTVVNAQRGESIAVNGVCLSLMRHHQSLLAFEVIPETQRLTNLGRLRAGARVNLERSLTLSDRLNGHLVFGHVDGIGSIVRVRRQAGQLELTIRVGRELRRYLAPKSPLAVDGVSMTVGSRLSQTACSVFLIPETLRKTTLGSRRVGDRVNLELDYIAKLVAQLVRVRGWA